MPTEPGLRSTAQAIRELLGLREQLASMYRRAAALVKAVGQEDVCKHCGKTVYWVQRRDGDYYLYDIEADLHTTSCARKEAKS